ncbi:hypothetical protein I5O09_01835 [Pseudomonas parafulva]|uniref:hypothetical protein n=1 Tax=Pseudomonas parafulva TaxID=157782 RepID=UPI0018D953C5|nr:hypothetical protein [Pseudomonas parafulva]MBH3342476.1 hypothetical protein [Pseudomonas parafulva]
MDTNKMRAVALAMKKSAKRELGVLFVMVIFGIAVAVIAVPLILAISLLPEWAWWALIAVGVVWMVFGETIAAGVRAYRGVRP